MYGNGSFKAAFTKAHRQSVLNHSLNIQFNIILPSTPRPLSGSVTFAFSDQSEHIMGRKLQWPTFYRTNSLWYPTSTTLDEVIHDPNSPTRMWYPTSTTLDEVIHDPNSPTRMLYPTSTTLDEVIHDPTSPTRIAYTAVEASLWEGKKSFMLRPKRLLF
jgi:uncharacterized protein (UPF0147 family)